MMSPYASSKGKELGMTLSDGKSTSINTSSRLGGLDNILRGLALFVSKPVDGSDEEKDTQLVKRVFQFQFFTSFLIISIYQSCYIRKIYFYNQVIK